MATSRCRDRRSAATCWKGDDETHRQASSAAARQTERAGLQLTEREREREQAWAGGRRVLLRERQRQHSSQRAVLLGGRAAARPS